MVEGSQIRLYLALSQLLAVQDVKLKISVMKSVQALSNPKSNLASSRHPENATAKPSYTAADSVYRESNSKSSHSSNKLHGKTKSSSKQMQ